MNNSTLFSVPPNHENSTKFETLQGKYTYRGQDKLLTEKNRGQKAFWTVPLSNPFLTLENSHSNWVTARVDTSRFPIKIRYSPSCSLVGAGVALGGIGWSYFKIKTLAEFSFATGEEKMCH